MLKLGIDIHGIEGLKKQGFSVSIFEHAKIIENYNQTKSMGKTAAHLNRSKSTISKQMKLHNNISECGFCLECRKASSQLEKIQFVRKGKVILNDQC